MTTTTLPEQDFAALLACWVCGSEALSRIHRSRFDLSSFAVHDPELHGYTGKRFWLNQCGDCGFMQPEALPTLSYFFDRLYTDYRAMQLRADSAPDTNAQIAMERDFAEGSKDFIFHQILKALERRVPQSRRTLLDMGAHVGRFLHLAQQRGWTVEGAEPNPVTSRFAAGITNAPIHQVGARDLALQGARFGAVTLTDVLEHIPDPSATLKDIHRLLQPGGCVSIKVPCGTGQLIKERLRSTLRRNYEFTIARNMCHVNHFGAKSLALALEKAGFVNVTVGPGAPELFPAKSLGQRLRGMPSNLVRLGAYYASRALPPNALAASMHLLALGSKR